MKRLPKIDAVKTCRDCGERILVSWDVLGLNGTRIPLSTDPDTGDLIHHSCEPSEEQLVLSEIQCVSLLNARLKTCQLRLVREDST
jgi:hypothetical protein